MTLPKLPSSFVPPPSYYRSVIDPDTASEFPAEPDRYALYLHLGCPFAHRTNIVYHLKHLQPLVALSIVSVLRDDDKGWNYDGTNGSDVVDPIEGFKNFKELYEKAEPVYKGSYSVPLIWDRKKKTIVSNDSLREENKPSGGLFPGTLKDRVEKLGNEIELDICWGIYKGGMAGSQADYDKAMKVLFGKLDDLEKILGGSNICLGTYNGTRYKTFPNPCPIRYGVLDHLRLQLGADSLRLSDLHRWLRELYYEVGKESKGAFKSTTFFEFFMEGYAKSAMRMTIVPWGPLIPIMPLDA